MPRTRLGSAKLIINGTPMPQRAIVTPSSINPALVLGLFAFNAANILDGVESIVILDAACNEGYDIEGGDTLNALEFPNLTSLGPDSQLYLDSLPAVGDLAFPVLSTAGAIHIANMDTLGTLAFPSLLNCKALQAFGSGILFSLTAPLLQTVNGAIYIPNSSSLTTLAFPALTTLDGALIATGCAFDQATVDGLLAMLIGIPAWAPAGLTCDLSGGTSAAPSVTGAADKATLIANGATVTTN